MIKLLVRIAIAVAFFGFGMVHEQPSLTQVQTDLVGSWLATVEGDARPRTLKITSVQQKSENVFSLEAVFGYSDTKQAEADAEISQTATERKLALTAKSGAKVIAVQTPNGIFSGMFHFTNGTTKPINLTKLSAEELRTKVEAALKGPEILKPAAEVPASCAAFSGKWTGTWGYGVGQQWLWVTSIDSKCMAKIAYLGNKWPPTNYEMVEIKDGVLEWLGNKSTSGTCVLKRNGDSLWANYSNPSGGTNNAVFAKIE